MCVVVYNICEETFGGCMLLDKKMKDRPVH